MCISGFKLVLYCRDEDFFGTNRYFPIQMGSSWYTWILLGAKYSILGQTALSSLVLVLLPSAVAVTKYTGHKVSQSRTFKQLHHSWKQLRRSTVSFKQRAIYLQFFCRSQEGRAYRRLYSFRPYVRSSVRLPFGLVVSYTAKYFWGVITEA